MIEGLPDWIGYVFLATSALTLLFFHLSNSNPWKITLAILVWSVIQCTLAFNEFYLDLSLPPRFGLVLIPALIFIVFACTGARKNWILSHRNTKWSVLLHIVRIPVEIVLLYLFIHKTIPELMTFEGRNFDILAGISAPIVWLLVNAGKMGRKALIVWNYWGLAMVLFILVNGLLSAELPIQQFAFDQPNRAIAYFPFILLPATVVPLVVYTHISDIIFLKNAKN